MKRWLKLILSSMLCAAVSGCTSVKSKAAYTVYPLGYIIERLSGGTVEAISIQEDGMVQRAQILPNYQDILADSAMLFYIGQVEPYMQVYAGEINESAVPKTDLSVLNAVYDFKRYTPVITGNDVTFVEGPYYRDPAFDLVDTDVKDLYLWVDPIAMLSMSKDILSWMKSTYPENASVYDENMEKLETDLINLDAQYQALATKIINERRSIKFVTMSAGFGNWQKTYGFEVYPVVLSKYGVLPNEEQLAVIEQRILEDDVRYIVYEPNMPEDMVTLFNRLEDELGLTRVEISNLSSLTAAERAAGKDYLSIMYENLAVLETLSEDRGE